MRQGHGSVFRRTNAVAEELCMIPSTHIVCLTTVSNSKGSMFPSTHAVCLTNVCNSKGSMIPRTHAVCFTTVYNSKRSNIWLLQPPALIYKHKYMIKNKDHKNKLLGDRDKIFFSVCLFIQHLVSPLFLSPRMHQQTYVDAVLRGTKYFLNIYSFLIVHQQSERGGSNPFFGIFMFSKTQFNILLFLKSLYSYTMKHVPLSPPDSLTFASICSTSNFTSFSFSSSAESGQCCSLLSTGSLESCQWPPLQRELPAADSSPVRGRSWRSSSSFVLEICHAPSSADIVQVAPALQFYLLSGLLPGFFTSSLCPKASLLASDSLSARIQLLAGALVIYLFLQQLLDVPAGSSQPAFSQQHVCSPSLI